MERNLGFLNLVDLLTDPLNLKAVEYDHTREIADHVNGWISHFELVHVQPASAWKFNKLFAMDTKKNE